MACIDYLKIFLPTFITYFFKYLLCLLFSYYIYVTLINIQTTMKTRANNKIYLIGHDEAQIVGAKLQINVQVLGMLFYNMRKVNLNLRSSCNLIIKEVEIF